MRLEVRRVDHDHLMRVACGRQGGENPVEYPRPAPSNEAIIQGFGWTVARRRIAPHQAVPDHMDDPADHPTVINTLDAPFLVRKKSLEPLELGVRQPKMMGLHQKSSKRIRGLLNHTRSISGTCSWVLNLRLSIV